MPSDVPNIVLSRAFQRGGWKLGLAIGVFPMPDGHGGAGIFIAHLDFTLQVPGKRFDDAGPQAGPGGKIAGRHADAVVRDGKRPVAAR